MIFLCFVLVVLGGNCCRTLGWKGRICSLEKGFVDFGVHFKNGIDYLVPESVEGVDFRALVASGFLDACYGVDRKNQVRLVGLGETDARTIKIRHRRFLLSPLNGLSPKRNQWSLHRSLPLPRILREQPSRDCASCRERQGCRRTRRRKM